MKLFPSLTVGGKIALAGATIEFSLLTCMLVAYLSPGGTPLAQSTREMAVNLASLTAASCVTLVSLVLLWRSVKGRLDTLTNGLKAMMESTGELDLTKRVALDGGDEFAALAELCNRSWDRFERTIAEVCEHSTLVGTYAGQLSIQSHRIVRNSREISGQSVTVATAGEEMAATSHEIAHSCSCAADNSLAANNMAENGQEVVQTTIQRMMSIREELHSAFLVIEKLGENSGKIGEIADTIQDIADQTNLLALNAAIEAARAGEQGRGFAVVADEVRALAERTAKATREIAGMIASIQTETGNAVKAMQRSVSEVTAGVGDADQSGAALGSIIGQIGSVSIQVSQIATAAEEQNSTTLEVVKNIGVISDSIAHFDGAAKEVNARVDQLMSISDRLKDTSTAFKVSLNPLAILNVAKQDHILFVNRIARVLDGKEELQAKNLPDHTSCRFGKWYSSEGRQHCSHSHTFGAIDEPHALIHRLAKEAVDLRNRGEAEEAEGKLHQVEELSTRIVSMLEQVKNECGSPRGLRTAV